MGSDEGLGHESPVHIVEISDKFYTSRDPCNATSMGNADGI